MTQALIILLVVVIFLHDQGGAWLRTLDWSPGTIVGLVLGVYAGIASAGWLALARAARKYEEDDRRTALVLASASRTGAMLLATGWHAVACLWIGWIGLVRGAIGDWVLIDEALVVAPAFGLFLVLWWASYPIERRLRETIAIDAVEHARPVGRLPSRRQHLVDQVRHQALLLLAPLTLILAWTETLFFIESRHAEGLIDAVGEQIASIILNGAHLLGVAVVFLLAPEMLRRIWSTHPLPQGETRDALERLLRRQRVSCRELLVWNTHSTLVNAAVVGFFGPLRYILLSDALIETLSPERIEAVMAHEVGHIRRRHIPWMLLAIVAIFGLTLWAFTLFAQALGVVLAAAGEQIGDLLRTGALLGAIVAAFTIFGFVSRRFERQADAFAAQHLSGMERDAEDDRIEVTPEAAGRMAEALDDVARLNHIPRRRFTWRHGSIAGRQRALHALVGRPVGRLPIDRTVRRIKIASIAGLAALVGVSALDAALFPAGEEEPPQPTPAAIRLAPPTPEPDDA